MNLEALGHILRVSCLEEETELGEGAFGCDTVLTPVRYRIGESRSRRPKISSISL